MNIKVPNQWTLAISDDIIVTENIFITLKLQEYIRGIRQ